MLKHVFGLASVPAGLQPTPIPYERVGFSWSAVAAGVAVTIAVSIFFAESGLALNLGLIDRASDAKTIGVVNAIAWLIGGLLAVFAGAWIAGRMANARSTVGGGIHGLAVWGAASIVSLVLAVSAAGAIGSGMVQIVGKGLDSAGKAAALVAPSWDSVKEELQQAKVALAEKNGSVASEESTPADENRFIDDSRLAELAGRNFTLDGSKLTDGERAEFVKLVSQRLDISPEATERTLAQWNSVWQASVQRFEDAKAEAVALADDARVYAATAAGWAAFAMLLGALAAAFGGAFGTLRALRHATDDRHLASMRVATHAPMSREEVVPPSLIESANKSAAQSSKSAAQSSKSLR